MNLRDIIYRHNSLPIEQEESLYVIKTYVKVRTGETINPVINPNLPHIFVLDQLQKMIMLTNHAINWFKNNPDKIDEKV